MEGSVRQRYSIVNSVLLHSFTDNPLNTPKVSPSAESTRADSKALGVRLKCGESENIVDSDYFKEILC